MSVTVDDRRARASMADVLLLREELAALAHRVQAIQDAVPGLDVEPTGFTLEYQALMTDGRWVHENSESAARLRRQGRRIRQRRVTEWTEIEP